MSGAGGKKSRADLPHAESLAARMLRSAIAQKKAQGISLRRLSALLGYKQPADLSQMAKGRVPIPLKRVHDIAGVLGIDAPGLLAASVQQRNAGAADLLPQVSATEGRAGSEALSFELASVAGLPAREISKEQREVITEVIEDPSPRRRWLAEDEVSLLAQLRDLEEELASRGKAGDDLVRLLDTLRSALRQS